ncbi:hypothetical protein FQA39_LY05731 [Lamprigera yunnana]|nr:hypothetical protein FQA39_LY05731 [Lamprigera yunnana]
MHIRIQVVIETANCEFVDDIDIHHNENDKEMEAENLQTDLNLDEAKQMRVILKVTKVIVYLEIIEKLLILKNYNDHHPYIQVVIETANCEFVDDIDIHHNENDKEMEAEENLRFISLLIQQ